MMYGCLVDPYTQWHHFDPSRPTEMPCKLWAHFNVQHLFIRHCSLATSSHLNCPALLRNRVATLVDCESFCQLGGQHSGSPGSLKKAKRSLHVTYILCRVQALTFRAHYQYHYGINQKFFFVFVFSPYKILKQRPFGLLDCP